MITMEDVSFAYTAGHDVLNGVDLTVRPGLTLLVGPNGCGKSTLLKIAAGIEKPDRGRVSVGGHDLWREEVEARSHLAYLPEHPDLTPYATVLEILQLVCGLRGRSCDEARSALEWVGLDDLGDRTIRELSKGQRRRATLAAARIGTPACLLLDEPIEGMDRAFRDVQLAWIERHVAEGGTAVVVSHEFELFAPLAVCAVTVRGSRCHTVEMPRPGSESTEILERLARGKKSESGIGDTVVGREERV
jgi:ABC-2 type transport system ATP-binding protein